MSYTALAYIITLIGLVSIMHINAKAMHINHTEYSCHLTAIKLV